MLTDVTNSINGIQLAYTNFQLNESFSQRIQITFPIQILQPPIYSVAWNRALTLYQTKKIVDLFNLKAFADDQIYVTEKLEFELGRVGNIMGKGLNAGYQHFLLFS